MHRLLRAALPIAVASLVVASCGSDSPSSTPTSVGGPESTSVETTASAVDSTTATSEGGNEATGEPVKIMAIMDESDTLNIHYETARAGLETKAAAINANGGLGGSGRPVEIEYCVTQLDPNQAAACAQKAADDPAYVATVGSVLGNGDASNPVLEKAGIANVGAVALAATDGTSTISFPVMSGQLGAAGGMAAQAYDSGFTKISLMYPDTPGGDQTVALMGLPLQVRGAELVKSVQIPTANPDLSPEVISVADGADAVIIAADPTTAHRVVQTFAQTGTDVQLVGSAGEGFTPDVLAELGDAADGMLITSFFATDDMPGDGVAAYVDAMKTAGNTNKMDDLAKNEWIALTLLDTVTTDMATIDRASILDGLSKLSSFDTGGLTPTLDFTTPGTFLGGAMPRFVNTTVVYGKVAGGKVVGTDGKFHDPFQP